MSRVFGIEFKAASYQLDDPAFGKYFVYLARYDVGNFGYVGVGAGTFGFFALDLGYSVAKERACRQVQVDCVPFFVKGVGSPVKYARNG